MAINTKIEFLGTKPGGKHTGGFRKITGTASAKGADPTTLKIAIDIDMNSIYSDDAKLTGHLMSPDFFGVKSNPTSKFVSEKNREKRGRVRHQGQPHDQWQDRAGDGPRENLGRGRRTQSRRLRQNQSARLGNFLRQGPDSTTMSA